jgi:hypothetical protein
MGRSDGFRFGLLGLILPGFLLYISDGTTTVLFFQGFFYDFLYHLSSGNSSVLNWISSNWFQTDFFETSLISYLYLASFALTILGLVIILINAKGGSLIFLLAGLSDLGLMLLHSPAIEGFTGSLSIFPLPIGAAILLLAAFVGYRDSGSKKVVSYVRKEKLS